ncbi:MAG: glycoside hydrolase, partial [Sphingobacteriaceae bacterium]
PTEYTTWRNYFENVAIKKPKQDWKFSQEDVLVSLVWGSQVMQRIAQQVRVSENKIIMAEKIAAINKIYHSDAWPQVGFDEAWRTLMLAQHHDCWIVPYNGRNGNTWADKVVKWTGTTNRVADSVIYAAPANEAKYVRVYNTAGASRTEWVNLDVPAAWKGKNVWVYNMYNKAVPSQIVKDTAGNKLMFKATVPSVGYTTYKLIQDDDHGAKYIDVKKQPNGTYKIESTLYSIIVNPAKGGIIESLIAKTLDDKEFVDKANERGFNELRGNFSKEGGFLSSKDKPAEVTVLSAGPELVKLQIKGTIGAHRFTQVLSVAHGQKRIDLQVTINYNGNPEIGEPTAPGTYRANDNHKGFYNDRDKLMALFPLNLKGQKVYKNAPYDVTESRLDNTFFTDWDKIKNNVLLNWVDVTDKSNKYGMALFTDHTTNYAHGEDFPLGLTLQYSGVGLWGRNYIIDAPTMINYSLVPHSGKWDAAGLWTESTKWNEPLVATVLNTVPDEKDATKSLINVQGTGYEVSSVTFEGNDLYVRLFNAEADATTERKIAFNFKASKAELVELNGNKRENLKITNNAKNEPSVILRTPRFALRTIKFTNAAKTN